ncbi:Uncharacterized conserved protein YdaU, DUF1376 family [Neorhodopirellula lusitana]|uniref:Uncharacterized conserved protein YdaU, DUF1376 family n=2 Tax=Neorhodopirellula lusitana TaxID=445327 RepID=A0ABY1QTY3_9BACT|nr:Uncharacterized conserved protein YdaU, DUF1376 family [Neorhodopirellula lusitana]
MPRRPWFPFNPSDYLADTRLLTLEAHGLYFLLLQHHWIQERLPDCPKDLAKLTGQDPRRFKRCFKEISQYFESANGYLTNKRMVSEIEKAKEKTEKARGSADARWHGNDANAMRSHAAQECERNANQNQQPTLNTTYVGATTNFEFDETVAREVARFVAGKLNPRTEKNREICWRAGYVVATGHVTREVIENALRAVAEVRPKNPFTYLFGCIRQRAGIPTKEVDDVWNNAPETPPRRVKGDQPPPSPNSDAAMNAPRNKLADDIRRIG